MMNHLLIIDVETGKVQKKIALGGDPKAPMEPLTLLAYTANHKIVAVASGLGIALVQIIDPLTGKRTILKAPSC